MIQQLILLALLVGACFLLLNYYQECGLPPIVDQFIADKTTEIQQKVLQ